MARTFFIIGFGLIIFLFGCRTSKEIKSFTTDACSCYQEGPKASPKVWEHCCISHDSLYWKGGSRKERKVADSLFRDCVLKTGYPKYAKRMYSGVRLIGGAWLPTPWRWGYGWGYGKRAKSPAALAK